jgi:hypothetical protein
MSCSHLSQPRSSFWLFALVLAAVWPVRGSAEPAVAPIPPPAGVGHALIVVGLPGDKEHEALFADLARQYRDTLTGPLGFDADRVRVLFGKAGKPDLAKRPASRAALEEEVADLRKALKAEDRLWVFFLGHANYDDGHAFYHLPGPDLSDDQLGKLLRGTGCREEVFWMTTSCSAGFLRPLSAKGRIVITATADPEEVNETEFPEALAAVLKRTPDKLGACPDGKVSVLELYQHTLAEVLARFAGDKRVPTEHAQLDDNGDGVGTEEPVLEGDAKKKPTGDGALAAKTFLTWKAAKKNP